MKTEKKCTTPIVSSAFVRPRRIFISYTDPFEDIEIASSNYHYDPRLSAKGIYSRQARKMKQALKSIQSHILEGRTPKISVTFL